MTKQELADAYDQYQSHMTCARKAARQGAYRQAVDEALEAWPLIDAMMQYGRRYADEEYTSISAIDLVLEYVPLLLDHHPLDRLENLLKDHRRIARDTATDLAAQLAAARKRMWDAYRLWDHIERHPDVCQADLRAALGDEQRAWVEIVEAWEKNGLLRRIPKAGSYRLMFQTRLDEVIPAKCPECASITKAPKRRLLEALTCPNCARSVTFLLLAPDEVEA